MGRLLTIISNLISVIQKCRKSAALLFFMLQKVITKVDLFCDFAEIQ